MISRGGVVRRVCIPCAPAPGVITAPQALDAQLDWIEADLAASDAQWTIVFGHHLLAGVPDKSASPGDDYYQQVVPRLHAAGVDLFLTGHSHAYSWTYPLLVQAILELNVTGRGFAMNLHRMLQPWVESANWNSFAGDGVQADGIEAVGTPVVNTGEVSTGLLVIDVTASLAARPRLIVRLEDVSGASLLAAGLGSADLEEEGDDVDILLPAAVDYVMTDYE